MTNAMCSLSDCDRQRYKRDWCNRHYLRWRRHGDPLAGAGLRGVAAVCSVEECEQPAIARGWCKLHYNRWEMHGDPAAAVKTVLRGMSAYDRVMIYSYTDPSGCRIYTGHRNKAGYGTINANGRSLKAHRVVLAHYQGWRYDMDAMHSCDNPSCVEITHLRWGTHAENIADAAAKGHMIGRPKH